MVKRLVRYVCEVCGAIFDDEKTAKECEGQNVQPFRFEIKEKVILKGTLFPEKAEIIGMSGRRKSIKMSTQLRGQLDGGTL